jgi:dephospho-CoA kinase
VFDIPLLFEKGGWRRVGAIAVVSAPQWVQRRRVLARPGMTPAKFRAIRRLQTPDRVKRARADFLIHTGCPKSVTRQQIMRIISCFQR